MKLRTTPLRPHVAMPPCLLPLHHPSSTSFNSISSSDGPTAIGSSADELVSLPSLHSLAPSFLEAPPFSTSFLFVTSLQKIGTLATAVAIYAPSLLLYSTSTAEISVYDLASLHLLDSFLACSAAGFIKSIAFSPDGCAFTTHQDGWIHAWWRFPRSGFHRFVASLPIIANRLHHLPLPSNYITICRHKKLLWIQHADAVSIVATIGLLYSISWDKMLRIWHASDHHCIKSLAVHDDAINAIAIAVDDTVYTELADWRIRFWRLSPGEGRHRLVAMLKRHWSRACSEWRWGGTLLRGL